MIDMKIPEMAFVGICSCGKLVYAGMDGKGEKRERNKEVMELIRDGYKVDRISVEKVRQMEWCNCERKAIHCEYHAAQSELWEIEQKLNADIKGEVK